MASRVNKPCGVRSTRGKGDNCGRSLRGLRGSEASARAVARCARAPPLDVTPLSSLCYFQFSSLFSLSLLSFLSLPTLVGSAARRRRSAPSTARSPLSSHPHCILGERTARLPRSRTPLASPSPTPRIVVYSLLPDVRPPGLPDGTGTRPSPLEELVQVGSRNGRCVLRRRGARVSLRPLRCAGARRVRVMDVLHSNRRRVR